MTAPGRTLILMLVTGMLLSGCARKGSYQGLMDLGPCDPSTSTFTTEVDNPYFPLPVGQQVELQGNGFLVRITVLDETRTVAGVETRVVEEYEAVDGRVIEISRNFFAQAEEGTVCYFGEEVNMYGEDGEISSHAGAWTADEEGNIPGIFMPASPSIGQAFQQEVAPRIAEDQSKIVAIGETAVVPAGTFGDTVTMIDRDPLGGGEDKKIYARGIGLIVDEAAEMTLFVPAD